MGRKTQIIKFNWRDLCYLILLNDVQNSTPMSLEKWKYFCGWMFLKYFSCSFCFSLFQLMDAWLLFLLLVKHWPHLHAQPTPVQLHRNTGIFLFNVNQHFEKKEEASWHRWPEALFCFVFFWQNSHLIQGNEKPFSICIILHCFLAHLHWCLVTTLALLNMLNSGGNRLATHASATVVNQGKCK